MTPDSKKVADILTGCLGRRVAVLGDVMLDAYTHGDLRRISPEAPVPVLEVRREEQKLGGAANAAKCLVALGAKAEVIGVVGNDGDADLFRGQAAALGVATEGLVVDASRPTTRKTRIVARQQQVIRVDYEDARPVSDEIEQALMEEVASATATCDALLISDYGKGVVTPQVAQAAIQAANEAGIPVLVDPKNTPWDHFAGATVLKPNRQEAGYLIGREPVDDQDVVQAGQKMIEQLGVQEAFMTRSEDGVTLVTRAGHTHYPVRLPAQLADPTGCGDVAAAVMLLTRLGGATSEESAYLANIAAGIKATKFGAYAVTDQEILDAVGSAQTGSERKIMDYDQAESFAAQCRAAGRRVVFTNGCFDLTHLGHTDYLERSKALGDILIVGINADASVKRLKGPSRPVQNEYDRARNLAAREAVDAVVVFHEDTPTELLMQIKPDVLTKGGDYKSKQEVVGWELVEGWGGRIALLDHVVGRSTTNLIAQSAEG